MQKVNRENIIISITVSIMLVVFSNSLWGREEAPLLESLDSELLKEEEGFHKFYKNTGNHKGQRKAKGTSSHSHRSKLKNSIKPTQELKNLQNKISKLQSELDILTDRVKKKQQEILYDVKLDNLVMLEAKIQNSEIANIQSIEVKIDSDTVFSSQTVEELWMPNDVLSIFYGSLEPGDHQVDVSLRIVMLNPNEIPINQSIYRFLNKSFNVSVGLGKFRKKWVFQITPPAKVEDSIKTELIESNLNT